MSWPAAPPVELQAHGSEYANLAMVKQPVLAIAEHDCAPWDGPAFGLWIPADDLGGGFHSWIYLRIWQDPRHSLGAFHFPDQAVKPKGAVVFFADLPSPQQINWSKQPRQQMKGTVRFTRVRVDQNIIGSLDFVTDRNVHLRGAFEARWIGSKRPC